MPKAEKIERVTKLKERIEGSEALLLTEYRGLTVSEITELRRSLSETDTSFAVIKNTLMMRAATDAGVGELNDLLVGPSAVAFVAGDPVAAAKKLQAAQKLYPALVLKGGFMDGRVLGADDTKALADLESREVMLSKIAGLLKGEMSRAASMFVQIQSKFLGTLEAYRDTLPAEPEAEAEPEPAAPEAEAEAEPAAEAEAEPEAAAEAEPATEAEAEPEATTDEEGKE